MLFGYETRKILKRIKPTILLILVVLIATTTMLISAIAFNRQPTTTVNVSTEYQALQTKIQNWNSPRHEEIQNNYQNFYQYYITLNADASGASAIVLSDYHQTCVEFNKFYEAYEQFIYNGEDKHVSDYLLVEAKYIDDLNEIMTKLKKFLSDDKTYEQIIDGLAVNLEWADTTIPDVLKNICVQSLSENDLVELRNHFINYPAGNTGYDYTDAYNLAVNKYWLALERSLSTAETYSGNLHHYIPEFTDTYTSNCAVTLAEYRLQHADQDFANPYQFGNIYNNTNQVSLLDFVFTNMEMATIPLMALVLIFATCAFFTDTYQNTIISAVTATRRRSTVILVKTVVVLTLSVLSLLVMTGVYILGGLAFFQPCLTADILFLYNGTKIATMSAVNYFVIYFLSLVWKMLPFIALCGLFSFSKGKPQIIVGATLLIVVAIILCNALLGGFSFYAYVPLLGLDPVRYFGAKMFLSPTPYGANILYTVPVVLLINVFLYWLLIHNFKRKDF